MGTYGFGEIREMCSWVRPHISVITGIAPVHLERMKTLENILDAKSEIVDLTGSVVINGDDFYGLESYQIVSDYYKNGGDMFTMVAYELGNTLSEFGGVTRGLCTLENDLLSTVIETSNLERSESGVSSDRNIELDGSEPVSMNVWGFTPDLFPYLKSMFNDFLKLEGKELHHRQSSR